jgi:hypothetical protein
MQLIQDVKNSFRKVHLTIGLINDEKSLPLLALHEKVETFKSFPGIDKICILHSKPTLEDLKSLSVDYVATADADFPSNSKVLKFEKKVLVESEEIFARVVRDYDKHVENLLSEGFDWREVGVSRVRKGVVLCKRNLRTVKKALWGQRVSGYSLDAAVDTARRWLQGNVSDWTERQEKTLRKWMGRCRSETSSLFAALKASFS